MLYKTLVTMHAFAWMEVEAESAEEVEKIIKCDTDVLSTLERNDLNLTLLDVEEICEA